MRRQLVWVVEILLWGVLAGSTAAQASTGGTPHQVLLDQRAAGSFSITGASMLDGANGINSILLRSSSARMDDVPADATVLSAWLFWAEQSGDHTDNQVSLTLPNGAAFDGLRLDTCHADEGACVTERNLCSVALTRTSLLLHTWCRRDVTNILAHLPPGGARGTWTVRDLAGSVGRPDSQDPTACSAADPACRLKYAGWVLLVVWTSPSADAERRVLVMDGYQFADEDYDTGGGPGMLDWSTLSGFTPVDGARAELAVVGLGGHPDLGVPPQDSLPQPCSTCADWVEVRSGTHPLPWRLTDGTRASPPGNFFNNVHGIDIKRLSVGAAGAEMVVHAADTALEIRAGSGDGEPGGDLGGGELVFLATVVLAVDEVRLQRDAGEAPDATVMDAAVPVRDAGTRDAAHPDASVVHDAGRDAGGTDAGTVDAGAKAGATDCSCRSLAAAEPGAGWLLLLAAWRAVRRTARSNWF